MSFESLYEKLNTVQFPDFTGTRIMMMPVVLGDPDSIPQDNYRSLIAGLFEMWPKHSGEIGYLTIDERVVHAGRSHRVPGKHVDSVCEFGVQRHGGGGGPVQPRHGAGGGISLNKYSGGWGGGHGSWAGQGTGMLLVSDVVGCRVWGGTFEGKPGPDGECDHLADQCDDGELMQANNVYWCDGYCVHESLPQPADVKRKLVRLSMPSTAPWFEGYTENPFGVKPTGPILPRRPMMNYET